MSEVNLKFNIHLKISESEIIAQSLQNLKYSQTFNDLENSEDIIKRRCPPRYRIYVNNDLITERSWIWKDSITCLEENIWVNLNEGVSIVKLSRLPGLRYTQFGENTLYGVPQIVYYSFSIKNLLVNNQLTSVDTPIISNQGKDIDVSFSI